MRSRLAIVAILMGSALAWAAEPQAPAQPREEGRVEPPVERLSPQPRVSPVQSNRCYTVAMNCILSDSQPRDSRCWCATPFGPSYGTVK